jgi:hypothetical protein
MRSLKITVLALVLGACSGTSLSPTDQFTPKAPPAKMAKMGDKIQTKNGNYVRVYGYQPLVRTAPDKTVYVAADVEGCAGPRPAIEPLVSPATFFLEMPGRVGVRTSTAVKEPALVETPLRSTGCARGWVTFHINKNRQPVYVVFIGKDVIKWQIG